MKKIIILAYLVITVVIIGGLHDSSNLPKLPTFNDKIIRQHNIIIAPNFFTNVVEFYSTLDTIERYLDSYKAKSRAYGVPNIIEIALVSGGGRVSYYEILKKRLGNKLKEAHVVCTIQAAGSMAFTFMMEFCDERKLLPRGMVMQHQVFMNFFGFKLMNAKTIMLSRHYSDLETESVGTNKELWWEITRMQGDKFFDTKEALDLNIITEVIKE